MSDFKGIQFYHWVMKIKKTGDVYEDGFPIAMSGEGPWYNFPAQHSSYEDLFFPIAGELKSWEPLEFGEYSK